MGSSRQVEVGSSRQVEVGSSWQVVMQEMRLANLYSFHVLTETTLQESPRAHDDIIVIAATLGQSYALPTACLCH